MKKIIYYALAATLAAGSVGTFSSCSDFLEAENLTAGGDKTDPESYFRTQAGLNGFRAYAYNMLKDVVTSLDINDDGTDLYMPCRGQSPSYLQNYTGIAANDEDAENYYVACYGLINNANGLIYYSGDDNPQYRMEGLFLRAYGYYLLTQHFGPVPYSDTYIQDANRDYPRVDLETIYTNCENDLLEVINSADIEDLTHDGSVNKRAARALLAKIYLAHGWDCNTTLTNAETGEYTVNSTENFKKAAEMGSEAVNGISLTQSFEEKWSPYNETNNPETFFAVQYERTGYPGDLTKGGHNLSEYYTHYYGNVNEGQKYSRSNKAMNTRSLALWEEGDTRWDATFMTTMYQYDTSIADWFKCGYFAYYNEDVDKNSLPIFAYFAPTYVSRDDFEAYLTEHKSQFVRDASIHPKQPHANLLHNGQILIYHFDDEGNFLEPEVINQNLSDNNMGTTLEVSPAVKKWDDPYSPIGGNTISYRDIVVLHASEVYLTIAEAYCAMGQDKEALTWINYVRDRAGAPHLNSLADYNVPVMFSDFRMIDLVLDERARECYAEQTRWMDLRRTKQLVRYNIAYNPYVTSVEDMMGNGKIKWYRPIPQTEISSNEGISNEDQNPGY